ncbi:MAG TPA: (d)CMP kinase [Bacteroidota bacterium]|nr:(d)CMP kinase [Bacteroidota bacterium]
MSKKIAIAIDGPAASGKSTTAKLVAEQLGYLHIDTGAMYRAITWKVLQKQISLDDEKNIIALAQHSTVRLLATQEGNKVLLDDEDITNAIRMPMVSHAVSAVSSYDAVRTVMVREQQQMAAEGGVVLDGRDIGTVVLPDADLKIFMIANVEERARRRKRDLAKQGVEANETDLIHELETRDKKDSTRAASPLKKAQDAVELDTSHLSIDEQVEFIVARAQQIIDSK